MKAKLALAAVVLLLTAALYLAWDQAQCGHIYSPVRKDAFGNSCWSGFGM